MAEYILDVKSQTSKLDWAFPFQRTGAFPIDRSALFSSLADAQKYALGDGSDERELGGTAYVGQVISVYEAAVEANEEMGIVGVPASVNAYIITPTRGLLKLAATTASSDVAADVAELQGQVAEILGEIDKINEALESVYTEEEVNALLANKANAGEVSEALALKADAENVYTKKDVYTKTEVEAYVSGQIGSAGHLKREIVEALPAVESADADTIYMIKKNGGLIDQDKYEEYMLINGAFEKIGDTYVDLSNYVTNEALNIKIEELELDKKADKQDVEDALAEKADADQVANDIAAAIEPLAVKQEVENALAEKADKTQVADDIAAAVENLAEKGSSLADYGIEDAYNKNEVDSLLLQKAGQQDHNELAQRVTNLEADGAIGTKNLAAGAVTAEKLADDSVNVDKIIDGAVSYEKLNEALQNKIDAKAEASNVYTKEEADNLLKDKANAENVYTKEESDGLLNAKANADDVYDKSAADELLKAKANAENVYTKAEANGLLDAKANAADVYVKSDVYTKSETDTKIDEKIASVTGGESAADVKLALETYRNAINVEIWGPEAANWSGTDAEGKPTYNPQYGNDTRIDKLEAVGAQANVIESISTPDGTLEIKEKNVALPLATAAKSGLVKGSAAENGVAIAEDGSMSVNSINVNKLVQTEGEYLILNGGGATV